jgi:MATE family multidrug resistance protein
MAAEVEHSLPTRVGIRHVFNLAWPITVSMLSYTVMGVVDTLFVGRLGTGPLAAVGLASVAAYLATAFPNGLMRGVKVNVAQRTGAGDHEAARRLGWQGVYLAASLGLLVASLASAGPELFQWMGASRAVGELASSYFGVRVLGAPLVLGMSALTAWFQGRGDTRTPMVANLLANGLNIVLDPIMIFGWGPVPAMGLPGAAAATVLAFGAGLAVLVWGFLPPMAGVPRAADRAMLGAIWRIGAPVGVHWSIEVGAWALFSSVLARTGEIQLAAHVMVIRIISVSFLPGHALSEAAGVLVGHAVGARRPEAARQAFRASAKLAMGLMFVMGLVFVAVPDALTAPFGATPEVAEVARGLLMVAATFQVFDALAMAAFGSLSGAGDTRFVMVAGILSAWLVKLPIGYAMALPMGMGAVGAWLGLTAEMVLLAGVGLWRVRGDRWLAAAFAPAEDAPEAAASAADAQAAK